ncbi:MAG TPA: hypothetical protein VIN09_13305, partial [Chloroflexota bacterium]
MAVKAAGRQVAAGAVPTPRAGERDDRDNQDENEDDDRQQLHPAWGTWIRRLVRHARALRGSVGAGVTGHDIRHFVHNQYIMSISHHRVSTPAAGRFI